MIAGTPVLDLDDAASLEAADSGGALRSAASGGAQVRATAATVAEEALDRLTGLRPRSLLMVSGAGRARRAAALLVAALGDRAGLPLVPVTAIPPWAGPLDVVLVAGDDAGDPRLIDAIDRAQRRGAEVVVAAPAEGPLRAAAAGRAALLEPRVQVSEHNRMLRFLAVGIAVLHAIDPTRSGALLPELNALADVLDAEALRDGPQHEVFHNPAKTLAARMQQRELVLAGDTNATTELATHAAEVLLQSAGHIATAVDLTVAVTSLPRFLAAGAGTPDYDPLFHDEELDGPPPVNRMRVFLFSADTDEVAARRKLAVFGGAGAGLVDADLVTADSAEDDTTGLPQELPPPGAPLPPDRGPTAAPANGRTVGELGRLAVLALRVEMAAAYLRLIGGQPAAGETNSYDGGRY